MAATDTSLTAGQRAAHEITLTASTVDSVTYTGYATKVRVINHDGADQIYVTVDGSAPTVKGAATYVLPAAISSDDIPVPQKTRSNTVVKLISAGTPTYTVQFLDPDHAA